MTWLYGFCSQDARPVTISHNQQLLACATVKGRAYCRTAKSSSRILTVASPMLCTAVYQLFCIQHTTHAPHHHLSMLLLLASVLRLRGSLHGQLMMMSPRLVSERASKMEGFRSLYLFRFNHSSKGYFGDRQSVRLKRLVQLSASEIFESP